MRDCVRYARSILVAASVTQAYFHPSKLKAHRLRHCRDYYDIFVTIPP
eukprot:SAG31_NODE_16434_length_709_cov_1.340984_1_plen_47_part_10